MRSVEDLGGGGGAAVHVDVAPGIERRRLTSPVGKVTAASGQRPFGRPAEGIDLVTVAIDVEDPSLGIVRDDESSVGVDAGQVEMADKVRVAGSLAADPPKLLAARRELRQSRTLIVRDVDVARAVDDQIEREEKPTL